MLSTLISRRALTLSLATIPAGLSATRAFGASNNPTEAAAGASDGAALNVSI
jgi:hypothetical protein